MKTTKAAMGAILPLRLTHAGTIGTTDAWNAAFSRTIVLQILKTVSTNSSVDLQL